MPTSIRYQIGDKITLEEALDFSLELAARGLGLVEPNPCVGSVLFNEETGELVSFGYHQKYGGPHAEVECLKDIESAAGLTLIVTLEPCSHYGKTPPCADLIVLKKPKKLIYMSKDPNPLVSGKGIFKIKEAGIEVEQTGNKYFDLNRKLNHKFFYTFQNQRAYVHLKWAESADGKTAVTEGSSWITSAESQEHSHFLRAQSQAVLIGRGTLELDDPSLNVRKQGYEQALKVFIFDPDLKSLSEADSKKISQVRPKKDVVFLCKEPPAGPSEYSFLKLHENLEGEWNLNRLARDLYTECGIQSIFVEGGAYTISQFLKQNVYNRTSVYRSPNPLGSRGRLSIAEIVKDKAEDFFAKDAAVLLDVALDYFLGVNSNDLSTDTLEDSFFD
ncbi:MAG: bifunctional diaminohydroxyphosphoribosylaminopyrimidine deaminase/5-amino-6-(5-phosphoribosylamino)uracil reductase RibD [Bdellovibrionales bacterium]